MESEVFLPFGRIEKPDILIMEFSTLDLDIPIIAAGIRERGDVLAAYNVTFAGLGTEVTESFQNKPVYIRAFFKYNGDPKNAVENLVKAYYDIWTGIIYKFPAIEDWAQARSAMSKQLEAQAKIFEIYQQTLNK